MVKTPSFLRANLDEKKKAPGGILTSTLGPLQHEKLQNRLLPPSSNLSLPKTHLPRRGLAAAQTKVLGLLSASLFFLVFSVLLHLFPPHISYAKHRLLPPPLLLPCQSAPSCLAGHHLDPAADGHHLSSSSVYRYQRHILFFHYPHFGSVATTFDLKSHRGSTIATHQSLSIFQIPLDITAANDSEEYLTIDGTTKRKKKLQTLVLIIICLAFTSQHPPGSKPSSAADDRHLRCYRRLHLTSRPRPCMTLELATGRLSTTH